MTEIKEPGAASILVDLHDGVITVTHGTDHVVLQQWTAERGDWDRIWETIYRLTPRRCEWNSTSMTSPVT